MKKEYNTQAHPFAQTYLSALQAIITFDQDLTGARLNKTRDVMARMESYGEENPCIDAVYLELKNKRIMERGVLYGDYKSPPETRTPWIKQPEHIAMIEKHLQVLGNQKDMQDFAVFRQKTEACFGITLPKTTIRHDLEIA